MYKPYSLQEALYDQHTSSHFKKQKPLGGQRQDEERAGWTYEYVPTRCICLLWCEFAHRAFRHKFRLQVLLINLWVERSYKPKPDFLGEQKNVFFYIKIHNFFVFEVIKKWSMGKVLTICEWKRLNHQNLSILVSFKVSLDLHLRKHQLLVNTPHENVLKKNV